MMTMFVPNIQFLLWSNIAFIWLIVGTYGMLRMNMTVHFLSSHNISALPRLDQYILGLVFVFQRRM